MLIYLPKKLGEEIITAASLLFFFPLLIFHYIVNIFLMLLVLPTSHFPLHFSVTNEQPSVRLRHSMIIITQRSKT